LDDADARLDRRSLVTIVSSRNTSLVTVSTLTASLQTTSVPGVCGDRSNPGLVRRLLTHLCST